MGFHWPSDPRGRSNHSISWAEHQQHIAEQAAAHQAALAAQQQAILRAQQQATQPTAGPDKGVYRGPSQPQAPTVTVTPPPPPNVDPFFTADDIISMNNWLSSVGDQRTAADTDLSNTKAEAAYQTTQVDQSAKEATGEATDNMIERGLFSSSVKDAAMYDIQAQRSLQQGLLQTQLHNAQTAHDTWISRYGGTMSDGTQVASNPDQAAAQGIPLGTAMAAFYQGWQAKAGENAKSVNDNLVAPPAYQAPNPAYSKPASVSGFANVQNHTQGLSAANKTPAAPSRPRTLTAGPGAAGSTSILNRRARTRTYTTSVVHP